MYIKLPHLFLIFCLFCCNNIIIPQTSNDLNNNLQAEWIEKIDDKLALEISFNNNIESFEVLNSGNIIEFSSNLKTNLRFQFNYRIISFGIEFAPNFLPGNNDDILKGETSSFEIGTTIALNKWNFEVAYKKVKGFYFENQFEPIELQNENSFIKLPYLAYYGFFGKFGYNTNNNFSIKSFISQTERQLKSTGSFMPNLIINYYVFDDISNSENKQKSYNTELIFSPGYIYTFVIDKEFSTTLGLWLKIGYLNTNLITRVNGKDNHSNQNNFLFGSEAKLGFGYNGNSFYAGIYSTYSFSENNQQFTTARSINNEFYYHIFGGIRFNSPQLLKEIVDEIENNVNNIF